jgi:hypothetical protein
MEGHPAPGQGVKTLGSTLKSDLQGRDRSPLAEDLKEGNRKIYPAGTIAGVGKEIHHQGDVIAVAGKEPQLVSVSLKSYGYLDPCGITTWAMADG